MNRHRTPLRILAIKWLSNDDLAEVVIQNNLGCLNRVLNEDEIESLKKKFDEFKKTFKLVESPVLLTDSKESNYPFVHLTRLIERVTDGKFFAFEYFRNASVDDEIFVDPNGNAYGFDYEVPPNIEWDKDYFPSVYVFRPIDPSTITPSFFE